jgi:hypothetical protein
MTQMNLWPKAKSDKRTKSQNGTCKGDAGTSSEVDGNLQGGSAKLNVAVENSQGKRSPSSRPELVASLFSRFQESEEQNKDANHKKAGVFADAKAAGLVAGALRAAFRQRVRELEKPDVGEKHDALNSLTRSYLEALRSGRLPAEQDDVSPPVASWDPPQGLLGAPRALA